MTTNAGRAARIAAVERRDLVSPWHDSVGKRALDLILAVPALLVASPVLLVIAALVRFRLGSPVFFLQVRTGRNGRPFVLRKFRTMTPDPAGADSAESDAARLTPFGAWLRSTSLDELPELVHVVRGDMSLVGPRPLLPKYDTRYSPHQARRLLVRPGLTGLAQVAGRNALAWEDRLDLDVEYVAKASLRMDAALILATVGKVLRSEGISSEGHAAGVEFFGSSTTRVGGGA